MTTNRVQVKPIFSIFDDVNFVGLLSDTEAKATSKVKPNRKVNKISKAEKQIAAKERRHRMTSNVKRQKSIIKSVRDGFNTTDKANELQKMASLPAIRTYFLRLIDDGYLSRIMVLREYVYSVTQKGLEFIRGNDE